MITFRLVWGFVGGEHARFTDFLVGPRLIAGHVRDLLAASPKRYLGHNPLGGAAVIMLLVLVAGVTSTGLFSASEDFSGPFAAEGLDLSDAHEALFRALQALVVVHILGVAVESWKTRDNLLAAMITGRKWRSASEHGVGARAASPLALALAIAAGAATLTLLRLASLS